MPVLGKDAVFDATKRIKLTVCANVCIEQRQWRGTTKRAVGSLEPVDCQLCVLEHFNGTLHYSRKSQEFGRFFRTQDPSL